MTNNLADRCESASGADAEVWECFQDSSYYDMWCVRQVGDRTFGSGFHLMRGEEATALRDLLNQRADAQGERAAVVAWLRDGAHFKEHVGLGTLAMFRSMITAIEAGEHLK